MNISKGFAFVVFLMLFSWAWADKRIEVDLKRQLLVAWEGGRRMMSFHCSTGRKGLETPTGRVRVEAKKRFNRALKQFGGGEIPYTLQIHSYDQRMKMYRHIDIHADNSVPNHPASHGCIRLLPPNAAELFDWAEVGTLVAIHN